VGVFLLVPAYTDCPEQRPLNGCVCVLIIPFLRELTYSSDPLDGSNDAASLKVCPWSFR